MNITKKVPIGAASLLVAAAAFVGLLSLTGTSADAMTITDRRDCGYSDPIIDCGAVSTEELLSAYDRNDDGRGNRDIQAIFNHYGVTRSVIADTANIKKGWLDHTTGQISVDGKVVGTNAQSLYRVNVPGKTLSPVSIGGKTYYIGNVAGQYKKGADVFVFYKNGKPFVAIQGSCGNPIPFVPKEQPKPPVFACEGLAADKISRDRFRFTASSSAANGAEVTSYIFNFGDGTPTLTTPNRTAEHAYAKAGTYTAKVTVTARVNDKYETKTGANCEVKITVTEEEKKPVFACESLKITKKISRTEFQFTATASAENATIKSYTFNFGDGNSKVVTTSAKTASATHEYADKKANYTASVTVTMSDGKTAPAIEKCKVPVAVEQKPSEKTPRIEIEKTVNGKEHAKVAVGEEFSYEITVRNTGNVVIKDAVVTDKAPSEVTLLSASAGKITGNEWKHTIADLGIGKSVNFTIKAKYAKYASGTHKNNVCVETPTVPGTNPDDCDEATTETHEKIEVCDLNDNTVKKIERSEFDESHMTTDLSKCGEIKVCIIENKVVKVIAKKDYDESTMTTDLSKCEEIPVVPPELPHTGLETFIGGGLGLGSLTAASYYWVASRKNLLSALLNK